MQKKTASLIYGNNLPYLDHLAPLSVFLNIPLITHEPNIAHLAQKFYPKLKVLYIDNIKINLFIVRNFHTIISCITKKLFDSDFWMQQKILNKEIDIIWCPHGNSDKIISAFKDLYKEKKILVYGNKMLDFFKEKNVLSRIKNIIFIGNYRLTYFKKFSQFYKNLIQDELQNKLPAKNKNILYAPTWNDLENSSSFWEYSENLFSSLPNSFNLICKIHPNTFDTNALKIEHLKNKYNKKNILFLDDFPVIYPLLDFVDIYIGDFSSIGYDFLNFNKPMFFFPPKNKKLSSPLFECGTIIQEKLIFEVIEKKIKNDKKFTKKRNRLYQYTFGKNPSLHTIKEKILK